MLTHYNPANAQCPALIELRSSDQWVAWRYKKIVTPKGVHKLTKPPVSPTKGGGASHSDPSTWSSYEVAHAYSKGRGLPGIGFVLTEHDGLTGIDLDKCRDPETGAIEPWAQEIIDFAESYTEISPSGAGLRILARGKVDHATKCDPAHVEIYGKQRYLTITGNHVAGTPDQIREAPRTIEALLARVKSVMPKQPDPAKPTPRAPASTGLDEDGDPIRRKPPHLIFTRRQREQEKAARAAGKAVPEASREKFFRIVNDKALNNLPAWFPTLFPSATFQPGTGGYRVTSKALGRELEEDVSATREGIVDFGVADMGDANLGKRTAVDLVMERQGMRDPVTAARWLCDQMNITPESLGWLEKSDAPPPKQVRIEPDGTIIDAETGEIIGDTPAQATGDGEDLPEHLTNMPGPLGELVQFLFDTTSSPSRTVSLATALAIAGTVAGRYWSGPTVSGTHAYIAVVGDSGIGKNHVLASTRRIMRYIGCEDLVGNKPMSQSALYQQVAEAPISCILVDEIGAYLGRTQGAKASNFEKGISETFRELWGANFSEIATPRYASRGSTPVFAPAVSILGCSTAKEFWGALEGADVTNGFLNRFLVFAVHKPADTVEPVISGNDIHDVPDSVALWLRAIHAGGAAPTDMGGTIIRKADTDVRPVIIPWNGDDAKKVYSDYKMSAKNRFEGSVKESHSDFYARAAESAVRLATLYALASNPRAARVSAEAMMWGRDLVEWSIGGMVRAADLYMSDNENQANANKIKRAIAKFPGRTCTRTQLLLRLNNILRKTEFDNHISLMKDSGQIEEMQEKADGKPGRKTTIYRLAGDVVVD